jgi:hypothetical protein
LSRTTFTRAIVGLVMAVAVLGVAPAAHAQTQGGGTVPTISTVGCPTFSFTTGDTVCPLLRTAGTDPTEALLFNFEYITALDAEYQLTQKPHWSTFDPEGYIGSPQSNVNATTGVITTFVWLYNGVWGIYHVAKGVWWYPDACDCNSPPEGLEEGVTYLGLGGYNL